jgi:aminobenzoyl-glutamate transport protein
MAEGTEGDMSTGSSGGGAQRLLDGIERLGNRVPHPVIMFLYLIAGIAVLSAFLSLFDISVTEDIAVPVPREQLQDLNNALGGSLVPYDVYTNSIVELPDYVIVEQTIPIRSLLDVEGLRFVFTSFVANFAGFGVVAVTLVAMAGVGVAEHAGMMGALIRRLVKVAPKGLIAAIIIFVGVLSSIASDAGYLILIPLGAAAFLSVGRHPLAGLAAGFAGVSAIFAVNLLITPIDSMLTEITNEAIGLTGGEPISVTANYYFSAVSSILLTGVAVWVTARIVEPRLGPYDPSQGDGAAFDEAEIDEAAEAKGLRGAFFGLIGVVATVAAMTIPSGGPLRGPTGGLEPLLASLIFIISLLFLVCGLCYGFAAKTLASRDDAIVGVTKTFAGLSGLIFMLLMISQFIAFFNYTNMPRVAAVQLAGVLEQANIGAIWLLVGMILVIIALNLILPGVVPKWAIFAPVFIPIFVRLDVAPQTVLAAYRIGDSPTNVLTPLMVYLPFIVVVAQRYRKDAGLGTVVALMLPYVGAIIVAWLVLFVAWFLLGIPLGPGYPVTV